PSAAELRVPVVRFGGSAQLNCSLACAGGTVQWKGLDTNVESITSFPTHSILHVSNATVATGGTKSCHGTCHGQRYQRTVNLKVYALPDALQLEATPRALEPGQPGSLRCSAGQVYPLPGLVLSWYRGDQALPEADFDATETEEELFNIVSTLPVAGEEVGEGVEFRCEVTLSIGQEKFTRVASVAVSAGGECWGELRTRRVCRSRPPLPCAASNSSAGAGAAPFLRRSANLPSPSLSPSPLPCRGCRVAPARCLPLPGAVGVWGGGGRGVWAEGAVTPRGQRVPERPRPSSGLWRGRCDLLCPQL
uniref:Ig-like domain-containing protein n=1 Tax=Otus sunia TaxID=257818 RepID=A0A8C8B7H5_9STRI